MENVGLFINHLKAAGDPSSHEQKSQEKRHFIFELFKTEHDQEGLKLLDEGLWVMFSSSTVSVLFVQWLH